MLKTTSTVCCRTFIAGNNRWRRRDYQGKGIVSIFERQLTAVKTNHFLLLLLLLCFFRVSAQFTWSNPQPSGWLNNKVSFTDSATGFIMNTNGDLITTSNSGNTWNINKNFPRCSAMDVKDSFLVIGGADTLVYLSTDRAQTWRTGVIQQNQVVDQFQIITKDTVFALCKNSNVGSSALYLSKNGGQTWQLVNSSFAIKGLHFIDSKLGYATSYGGVYKTVDGGATWQNVYTPRGGYSFIYVKFYDQNFGFAVQDLDSLRRTTDGGKTWKACLPSNGSNIFTIAFGNAANVFAAGEEGLVYRSSDSGKTWQYKPDHTGDRYGIYSIYFQNSSTGFLVGLRGQILKTTDTCNSYKDYSPTYTDIKPISFPTPTTGYAAAWTNIFKTTDAGKTWTKQSFTLTNPYNRIEFLHFFSNDTGLVAVDDPVQLFKTYNGGQSWQTVNLPVLYKDYVTGFFTLGNTVYVNINGAYGYTMIQSKDRGETWRTMAQLYPGGHRNLFFVDEKTGYASIGPELYKTTDSAKSWTKIFVNDIFFINSIWFTSASTGYAVGEGGYNQITTDSGRTWRRMNISSTSPYFDNVFSLRFFDKKLGYLTSGYGGIYKTFDGGNTWRADKQSPWDCYNIEMTADTAAYVAGLYGIILKKDMREYIVDSLAASVSSSCGMKLSAKLTAVYSQVDSAWFEYGIGAFTAAVSATPFTVKDSTVKCEALLQNLVGDGNYVARVKVFYRGNYSYSSPIAFQPGGGLSKPTITFNGTVLSSSAATGNQWYLNNAAIPGATGTTYQPTAQGTYTVQQKANGCSSAMSDGFNFVLTAINDPVLAEAVRLFPNPMTTTLWIKNKAGRKLQLLLTDCWGRTIKDFQTIKTESNLDVQNLSAGIYIIVIEDLTTHKKTVARLVKL